MTTTYLFANNAHTTLSAPITSSATSVSLASGSGSKFPSPSGDQVFTLTLTDAATGTNTEVMLCTARSGDTCTVVRGQEGTTAQAWTTGDFADNFLTAGAATNFDQNDGGGSGTDLAWVVVAGFTDADVTTAVAAINAAPHGGVIYFPPGIWENLPGGYVFTKPVTVYGCGPCDNLGQNAITRVECDSATAILFDLQADPWMVQAIHLKNTHSGAPTAGNGIHTTVGNGHRLRDVVVEGFYDNIAVENASEWFWTTSFSYGWVNYGALIRNTGTPDGGDQKITSCAFIAHTYNSTSAIRYESGGGLDMVNVKINNRPDGFKAVTGLDIELVSGAETCDIQISNTSIENVSGSCIKMLNASGSAIPEVTLNGIQMQDYSGSLSPIDIESTSGGGAFDNLILNSLQFRQGGSPTAACIRLTNVNNVSVGPIINADHPDIFVLTNVTKFHNMMAAFGVGNVGDDGTNLVIDGANHSSFRSTISGDRVLANPVNVADGTTITLRIITGGHALTYGSKFDFPTVSGTPTPPTLVSTGYNVLSFQYDATDDTYALVGVGGFA